MSRLSPSATVRSQARNALKGNYVAAVASFVILILPIYLITGLLSVVSVLLTELIDDKAILGAVGIVVLTPLTILSSVLLSPLFNGFVRAFYEAAYTREFRLINLFYYFSKGRYHRALHLNLSFLLRIILPAMLFFLPLFVYNVFCYNYMDSFVDTVLYKDFAFLLSVMSSILLILYSLKYFLVFTLFCSEDKMDSKEIFSTSKAVMQEQKGAATKLIFSFTPWMLLCLLIIPALYVVPYMTQSLCIGAKWMTMKGE